MKKFYLFLGAIILIAVFILQQAGAGAMHNPVYYVCTGEKSIAFTFDVLWERGPIEELLAVLDREGITATFFITGLWAETYKEETNMIKAAGHELGNHTYSHEDLLKINSERVTKQIKDGVNTITAITGERPIYFRPPYGSWDRSTIESCRKLDQHIILWDIDSRDWIAADASTITDRVTKRVKKGSIVLFRLSSQETIAALPEIIRILKQQNFSIVTVGQLLNKEGELPEAPYRSNKSNEGSSDK